MNKWKVQTFWWGEFQLVRKVDDPNWTGLYINGVPHEKFGGLFKSARKAEEKAQELNDSIKDPIAG